MAADDAGDKADDNEKLDPAELLKQTQRQLARNKIVLIVSMVISGVIICVLGTGLTVMFMRIAELQTPPDEELEQRFVRLDEQLAEVTDFRRGEKRKIDQYIQTLEMLRADCSMEKAAPFRDFLITRETDFQQTLRTIMAGTSSLANMAPGSRKWVERHNKELQGLIDKSKMRQQDLKSVQ